MDHAADSPKTTENSQVCSDKDGNAGDRPGSWGREAMRGIIEQEERSAKRNELLFSSMAMLMPISGMIAEIFSQFKLSFPINSIYFFLYLLAMFIWVKSFANQPAITILVGIVYLSVMMLAYFQTPEMIMYLFDIKTNSLYDFAKTEFVFISLLCLPMLLMAFQDMDMDLLYHYLRRYSTVCTFLFFVLMAVIISKGVGHYGYMPIAYNALPGICILFLDSKLYERKSSALICLLGVGALLMGGCRGALATFLMLVVIWWLHTLRQMTAMKMIGLIVLSFVVAVIAVGYTYFLGLLVDMLSAFNFSSRVLTSLLAKSDSSSFFLSLGERDILLLRTWSRLNLFGHGIYSDRLILGGTYPHNIVLEILYDFGWIFGSIFIAGGFIGLWHIRSTALKQENSFLLGQWSFLVAIIGAKLMVSSTYLSDLTFWACIGLVTAAMRNGRQMDHEIEMENVNESL